MKNESVGTSGRRADAPAKARVGTSSMMTRVFTLAMTLPTAWVATLATALAAPSPALAQILQAKVSKGALTGKLADVPSHGEHPDKVAAFLGVPFAAPPVGANRWKPPAQPAAWKGEHKATEFAASCQQGLTPGGFGPWTAEYVVSNAVSEDCLYLNVWTPARSAQEKLPVLVWIYGGGFSSGGTQVPVYNGGPLASKGIVVVTVNYRVGVYGFLAHPELTAESPAHASGNYGLMDQAAALRWVKKNIAAFGGDPSMVTIAGQSAGAASVHHLIASPMAKGLFNQAIAQSGSGMGIAVPARTVAEEVGKKLSAAGGGVPLTLAQLRALKPQELDDLVRKMQNGQPPGLRFLPVVDGSFLPDAATVGANTNDTPILTGMTANESTAFNSNYGKMTVAQLNSHTTKTYGALAPEVAKLYSAKTDPEAQAAVDALARDRALASMWFWASNRMPHTQHAIYAYLWGHVEPGPDAARYKAFHSSEIPYVFDTLEASPSRPFTEEDRALAERMSNYWVQFVKTGNPNRPGLPAWPKMNASAKELLEFGGPTQARAVLEPENLALFEKYTKNGGQLGLF